MVNGITGEPFELVRCSTATWCMAHMRMKKALEEQLPDWEHTFRPQNGPNTQRTWHNRAKRTTSSVVPSTTPRTIVKQLVHGTHVSEAEAREQEELDKFVFPSVTECSNAKERRPSRSLESSCFTVTDATTPCSLCVFTQRSLLRRMPRVSGIRTLFHVISTVRVGGETPSSRDLPSLHRVRSHGQVGLSVSRVTAECTTVGYLNGRF